MFEKPHNSSLTGSEFEPWITRDSIEILKTMFKNNFIGLEWGSGSSSVWFLERLKFLYTIEHDIVWKNKVEEYMIKNRQDLLSRWELRLIEKDQEPSKDPLYIDGNGISRKNYCLFCDSIISELDFISIDGRSRKGCISSAVKKIKKDGGIIVLDNSDRVDYYPNDIPKNWEKIETTNGIWNTTIWVSKT